MPVRASHALSGRLLSCTIAPLNKFLWPAGGDRRSTAASNAPTAASQTPRAAPAVLLRLDRAGLHLPGWLRAPGTGGRDAVGLRRAHDRRLRLVAHRDGRRGVAGRRAGGVRLAADRPGAR